MELIHSLNICVFCLRGVIAFGCAFVRLSAGGQLSCVCVQAMDFLQSLVICAFFFRVTLSCLRAGHGVVAFGVHHGGFLGV